MKMRSAFLTIVSILATATGWAGDSLEQGFANPPDSTKPWCYWYWISDNMSREGITRDLEAMKRVGIGEALIGNIYLDDVTIGNVKALSEEWWGMVEHAIREGGRIGVDIGFFNCPGWSQSGGPWIQPHQAMRYLASTERRVKGPASFKEKLEQPAAEFQDVAVLAFRLPAAETETLAGFGAKVSATPTIGGAEALIDGKRASEVLFPKGLGGKPLVIDLELEKPMTAQSLVLVPAKKDFATTCELLAAGEDGSWKTIRSFPVDRSNNGVSVGFVPHAPVAITFPPTTGKRFRLSFTGTSGEAGLGEIELSGAARVERFMEKQLAKMHPTPLPMWDAYLWPPTAEPGNAKQVVNAAEVRDLSRRMTQDGTLHWEVPEGEWVILRTGMTPTGIKNAPASPQGQGLEVDKMSCSAVQGHYESYIGALVQRLPRADRKAFKHVVADSYEMGSQNWTDGLREVFKRRYGYDPQPWLPVLTGRVVGSGGQSDRFLWDLRRLVADQVAYDYVGCLREAAHQHDLRLWLENYGHWGFPGEFLQYGGQSDDVSGEFWATGDLGSIELRAAASAAHIYGKPIVSAEAFTSVQKFEATPWSLKKRGDWALTEGINHWVLHVYIHQPWEDRLPGVNAWFSTEFNRHNTWFEQGREWIDYYRRCQFLLQQGKHVADVAYFIGEDVPRMTGIRHPPLPAGYNFDYINAEVILKRLQVEKGRFVLPDGMSYRVLVLPVGETMRPELLSKLRDLIAAGGVILGAPPSRSPSLKDFPAADRTVQKIAAEIWKDCDGTSNTETTFGKGRVFRNVSLETVFKRLELAPDFATTASKVLWTHRATPETDIYFLSNQAETAARIAPVFRVAKAPEFWDAVSARTSEAAVFEKTKDGLRVAVELEPRGSLFVVFRRPLGGTPAVTAISQGERTLVKLGEPAAVALDPGADVKNRINNFTMAGWVRPQAGIALPREADEGVFINLERNDAVVAVHGQSAFSDPNHSGAGLSVGTNGIAVYEHSGNYFAPLLVHQTLVADWTHIAVVYREGRPQLYLNVQPVHTGVKSRYQVHSSLSIGDGPNPGFKGELAGFQDFGTALPEEEIARLGANRPSEAAKSALPAITLSRGSDGKLVAELAEAGPFTIELTDGKELKVTAADLPAPMNVDGEWTVRFPSGRDVPETIAVPALGSLTGHTNEAIRYFAGTATYTKTVELPAERLAKDNRVMLDLGRVEALAEVVVNGRNLGVFWKPPFVVDITSAARAGDNTLEIQVTGTWRNRLIGAAKYPKGFTGTATGKPEFQPYTTADLKLAPDSALSPFGLIGPVTVRSVQSVSP
jgi:hypothetical protein